MVVEIPPADADQVIVGSFDVAWQNALADVGPAGADKGKGAKYLITPPGYKENAPDGYIVLPSETYRGFVILRSNFKSRSDADIKSAVEHGKRVKLYPLGGNPGRRCSWTFMTSRSTRRFRMMRRSSRCWIVLSRKSRG